MQFQIPKQNDRSIITALGKIRSGLEPRQYKVAVQIPWQGEMILNDKEPENTPSVKAILAEDSEIIESLYIKDGGTLILQVSRTSGKPLDAVNLDTNSLFFQNLPQDQRFLIYAKLLGLSRKHLRAFDSEATLTGLGDNEWSRYRDSQQAILNSLEETQKNLLVELANRTAKADEAARARINTVENELYEKYKALENELKGKIQNKNLELDQREKAIAEREKSFNTKEARYVARQGQEAQITQIQGWL